MEISKLVKSYREAVARLDNLTDAECMNDELTDRLIDEEVSLQEQIIWEMSHEMEALVKRKENKKKI